jgi:hypothetical protein
MADHRTDPPRIAVADPVSLVRQYVKRDANGERLQADPWFQQVVTWSEEPGYDSYTVIRSYSVEPPPTIQGSPAEILVRYDVIGWVQWQDGEQVFLDQEMSQAITFVVVRDDNGWRIDEPQFGQRVLAEVAAASQALSAEDTAHIRELASKPPT